MVDMNSKNEAEVASPVNHSGTPKPDYLDDLPPTPHPRFRAERLKREDLGPVRVVVIIQTPERQYACALQDVSTSGLAFERPADFEVTPGARIRRLSVVSGEHELYAGGVIVRAVRKSEGLEVVGASFLDEPMNMDDVIQLRAVRERQTDPRLDVRTDALAWSCDDDQRHQFQSLIAEKHLFLRDAEARFHSLEADLPWHVLHGEKVGPARQALIEQLHEGFVPAFVDYTVRIDAALRKVPIQYHAQMKAYARAMIQDSYMLAPLMHRCLTKPLGYPGDYVIMRYLYEDRFEGPTLWAKALHLAGTSAPACCAVRTRKDMVLDHLRRLVEQRAKRGLRTKVLSVASGPAQETIELLRDHPDIARSLDILLFDQDRDALEFVNNRLNRLKFENGQAFEGANIHLRHDTIRRLLEDDTLFEDFGPVDLVFCSGLFDYLRFHTGVRLLRNLHATLGEGGRLLAGNLVPEQPTRWVFDFHMDWFLEYRSREQLLAMGEAACKHSNPSIIEESTGWNPFVQMHRS